MAIPWNEDDPRDAVILVQNLTKILRQAARQAHLRRPPTVSMAQEWHRQVYEGVRLPVPYYAGEIRDSDSNFPELYGYEVRVGSQRGVDSRLVPQRLASFERTMKRAVAVLDLAIPAGVGPGNEEQLQSVLTLCANAHGEWIRIHPFANGNGRTARLWANWCALRYGLPPFVRLKPRPAGSSYATASALSMEGDHEVMVAVFADMLDRHLGESAS
ncbi:MAG TPA: Fic family protein [Thermoanaerobaculia bacterium]|nr:Fic family protein [Thermoanaerobaculia bacterium]